MQHIWRRIIKLTGALKRSILFFSDPATYYCNLRQLRRAGMKVGKNVNVLPYTIIDQSRPFLIEIGDNVTIAPRCHILTHDASMNIFQGRTLVGKVKILDNCFIGAGSIILPGVSIGPNAVVGAGSVVTKSVPPRSVVGGNPARVICGLKEFLEKHEKMATSGPNFPHPGTGSTEAIHTRMKKELEDTVGYSVHK